MMASMEASNVSMCATPLSANPSRIRLCLRARAPMIASAYTYRIGSINLVIESKVCGCDLVRLRVSDG